VLEDVKEESGFTRNRCLVRRKEDSCLRELTRVLAVHEQMENDEPVIGRRGTRVFIALSLISC